MGFKLRISLKAELDIIAATEYYDRINDLLGNRFLDELSDIYEKLKSNPQFYSLISSDPADNFRDIAFWSFPYIVVFELEQDNVTVMAVICTHTDH